MNKSFLVIAAIFVLVGGSIGGAFVGGMIVGENRWEEDALATAQYTQAGQAGQSAALQQFANQVPRDEDGNPDFAAIQQLAQTQGRGLPAPQGQPTTDSTDTISDGADGATTASTDSDTDSSESADTQPVIPGIGGRGLGLFGGGATFGTIDSIADDIVVINTPEGPVEAAIGPDTAIQVFTNGELADLTEGMSVTVMGQLHSETGRLDALTIIGAPESAGAFPGLGGLQNRGQGGASRGR